jgi:hypothetical protein
MSAVAEKLPKRMGAVEKYGLAIGDHAFSFP